MTAKTVTEIDESPMFAPIPSWERGKKRRGFGRAARPAEPRSFAPAEPITEPMIERTDTVDPVEVDPLNDTFAAAPVYASRTQTRSSSTGPVAIAAGLILIGGVAAAGWYYSQPHGQTGVAELTPGGTTTTTSETTTAPSDAAPPPSQTAQAAPPPVARTTTSTKTTRTASASRTRAPTASSRSAGDNSADTSATAPMPLPTPGVAPPPAAATAAPPAPLVLNIPPAATAPAAPQQPVNPPTAPQTTAPPPTEVPQA